MRFVEIEIPCRGNPSAYNQTSNLDPEFFVEDAFFFHGVILQDMNEHSYHQAYYMNGFSYVQGILKRIEVQGLNNRMGTVQSVSINRFLG